MQNSAAARQQLHGAPVDLAVAALGAVHGPVRFREGRRVEDDVVKFAVFRFPHLGEQLEDVRLAEGHIPQKLVAPGVSSCHLQSVGGDVHGADVRGPGLRGVEGEGARVREAVKHPSAGSQPGRRLTVVLLVEEEARLLAVHIVDLIADPVFADLRHAGQVGAQALARIEALALLHALQLADAHVVALVEGLDGLAALAQNPHKEGEEEVLSLLHAEGERLRDEYAAEAIDRQAGEEVCLAEDEAAAGKVRAHHGAPVVDGVAQAALEEGLAEIVVCVAREQAQADFRFAVEERRAEPAPPAAEDVGQSAVGRFSGEDLRVVDPRVTEADAALRLFRDGELGKLSFHSLYPFSGRGSRPACVANWQNPL